MRLNPQLNKLFLPGRVPMPGMERSTGVSAAPMYLLDASELDAKIVQGDGGERDTTNGRKGSNWWESHTG